MRLHNQQSRYNNVVEMWHTTWPPLPLAGESVMDMDYKTRLVILALIGLVALVLNTYTIA